MALAAGNVDWGLWSKPGRGQSRIILGKNEYYTVVYISTSGQSGIGEIRIRMTCLPSRLDQISSVRTTIPGTTAALLPSASTAALLNDVTVSCTLYSTGVLRSIPIYCLRLTLLQHV